MSSRILQSGRACPTRAPGPGWRCGRQVAAALALVLAALFCGCGNLPPEPFWEPNTQDSAAIDTLVNANAAFFKTGLAELQLIMIDTVLPGSTGTKILPDELHGNPFKQRFRADKMQHVFTKDSLQYTFIATLDTVIDSVQHDTTWVETTYTRQTATVTIAETIPGELLLHAFKMTDSLRESLFFPSPGETLRLGYYDSLMTPRNTVITKKMSATTTGGCVLKKDSTGWKLWKVAGGSRFYAPNPDDAPYFFYIYLSGGGQTDTITLRPDTLHYGMQRLYPLDDTTGKGVPTFTKHDTLRISGFSTNNGNAATYLYFRGHRYEFKDKIPLDTVPAGLYRLYLEHIPVQVFWEVQGNYSGTIWGVPVRVKE